MRLKLRQKDGTIVVFSEESIIYYEYNEIDLDCFIYFKEINKVSSLNCKNVIEVSYE